MKKHDVARVGQCGVWGSNCDVSLQSAQVAWLAKNEFFRGLSVELNIRAFADRCRMMKNVYKNCLWLVGLFMFHEHMKCQCD